MRKICALLSLCSLLVFITFIPASARAISDSEGTPKKAQSPFELQNGDRVVFLGNSLLEFYQQYGYIEFALTSRWPNRAITFRNLGWTGDTVFGDARSYFTSSPNAYELLIQQITQAKPTVVFLAYGANEAYEGEAGLSHFVSGLNTLIDKIDSLGAKTILLSPIPQLPSSSPVTNLEDRNHNLELYTTALSETATERDLLFIDLFKPIQELSDQPALTTDGVHLSETGYYHLAAIIEDGLGLPPRQWIVSADIPQGSVNAQGSPTISDSDLNKKSIKITVNDSLLPLPLPKHEEMEDDSRRLTVKGLDKGFYTLQVDDYNVVSATARKWSEGVAIRQGALFEQADQLQDYILKKNELFFRQYRPQNRTYLIGFRSYEQGQNVKDLEQLDILIGWLEEQIATIREPKSHFYQLSPIK